MRVVFVSRALVFGGLVIGTFEARAFGGFQLISHSHVVHVAQRETTFTLEFNEPPDFERTVPSPSGATQVEANAFQVFYGSNFAGPDFLGDDVVVLRGPEIRYDGDLRVRDTLGMDDSPPAGGFGPVRGSVPIDVVDETVTFTVPWKLLGETDQNYRFIMEAYDRGELTSSASVVAPLPAAVWPAIAMLGGLLTTGAIRKRLRRRGGSSRM